MSAPLAKRPNFLILLADDLGYSDIGCFGSEISTPNLDKLANEGVRFSDYHVASLCSPTRSMIMSGTDAHLAGLGVMPEFSHHDRERWDKPGHEGYLNHDVAALPELLQDAGYLTLMTGKWHLGYRTGYLPPDRGFDKNYSLLQGCHNHFAYEPEWHDEPLGLPKAAGMHPWQYVEGNIRVQPEPNTTNSSSGFYSSDAFAEKMISYLSNRTSEERDKPFFGYLAFTATHWPLQCLPEDRDLHQGKYDDGPDALRLRRLARMKELGLIADDVVPHPITTYDAPEWNEMSPEEQRMSSRTMEVFAGMVTGIDRGVGKVVSYLDEIGELDNTVVMFMSDNGAEGAVLESGPIETDGMKQAIKRYYNNSYENLGNHDSYTWYGPRWAQASTAPNRLAKRHTTEGGIRVPLLMRYPPFSHYQGGAICPSFTTCMDIMPTFLELAKAIHPNASPSSPTAKAEYRGKLVYPPRGKSWVDYLATGRLAPGSLDKGGNDAIHSAHDAPVGWESNGCAALRYGKWKILNMPATHRDLGRGKWELFDLENDQGETNDLSEVHPEKVKELLGHWDTYVKETGTVWTENPVDWSRQEITAANWDLSTTRRDQSHFSGGDYIEDQKAWLRVKVGETLPLSA